MPIYWLLIPLKHEQTSVLQKAMTHKKLLFYCKNWYYKGIYRFYVNIDRLIRYRYSSIRNFLFQFHQSPFFNVDGLTNEFIQPTTENTFGFYRGKAGRNCSGVTMKRPRRRHTIFIVNSRVCLVRNNKLICWNEKINMFFKLIYLYIQQIASNEI